jgi:hypothetical protein
MVNQALETSHTPPSSALCLRASVAASSSPFNSPPGGILWVAP